MYKKLIVVGALLLASLQAMAAGLIGDQPLGTSGIGRQDAQIEARNTGGVGHGLISCMQMVNPGVADRECALSMQGYDATGQVRQFGAMSYMWVDPSLNGYAVLRHEVNTVMGSGEIPMRLFGGQRGITLFGANGTPGDHDPAGGPFVRITRSSGFPSMAGTTDLAIEGKAFGTGTLFLNAYGQGNIYIGGIIQFAQPSVSCAVAGASRCQQVYSDGVLRLVPLF